MNICYIITYIDDVDNEEDCENYVICFVSGQIEVYDWIDLITNNKEIREE